MPFRDSGMLLEPPYSECYGSSVVMLKFHDKACEKNLPLSGFRFVSLSPRGMLSSPAVEGSGLFSVALMLNFYNKAVETRRPFRWIFNGGVEVASRTRASRSRNGITGILYIPLLGEWNAFYLT